MCTIMGRCVPTAKKFTVAQVGMPRKLEPRQAVVFAHGGMEEGADGGSDHLFKAGMAGRQHGGGRQNTHRFLGLPAHTWVPLSKLPHFSELLQPHLQKGRVVPFSWWCCGMKDSACKGPCPTINESCCHGHQVLPRSQLCTPALHPGSSPAQAEASDPTGRLCACLTPQEGSRRLKLWAQAELSLLLSHPRRVTPVDLDPHVCLVLITAQWSY